MYKVIEGHIMKARKFTKETIRALGEVKKDFPTFKVGDTIAVSQRIKEGDKERLQVFEGDVIAIHKNGVSSTFTIRRIGANAVAVERIFPFYSPKIEAIRFIRQGKVRRAKLYYMRDRVGKSARVKERVMTREQKEQRISDAVASHDVQENTLS
jgi:large subunit ribosomal protein L19